MLHVWTCMGLKYVLHALKFITRILYLRHSIKYFFKNACLSSIYWYHRNYYKDINTIEHLVFMVATVNGTPRRCVEMVIDVYTN